jgi:hypothetical protein
MISISVNQLAPTLGRPEGCVATPSQQTSVGAGDFHARSWQQREMMARAERQEPIPLVAFVLLFERPEPALGENNGIAFCRKLYPAFE